MVKVFFYHAILTMKMPNKPRINIKTDYKLYLKPFFLKLMSISKIKV